MKVVSVFVALSALASAAVGQVCLSEAYDHAQWPNAPFSGNHNGVCETGYWAGAGAQPERFCHPDGSWDVTPSIRCLISQKCPNTQMDGWEFKPTQPSNTGNPKAGVCPLGWSPTGTRTLRCHHDPVSGAGVWAGATTGTGVCNRNQCAVDGSWPQTNSLETASLPCPDGFIGDQTRFCTAPGIWDAVVDNCVAAQNICLPEVYDHTNWEGVTGPATAAGTCLPGYGSVGTPSRPCLMTGWSNKNLQDRCLTLYCEEDSQVIDGTVVTWGRLQARKKRRFLCPSGSGYAHRRCDENGSWEATTGECVPTE